LRSNHGRYIPDIVIKGMNRGGKKGVLRILHRKIPVSYCRKILRVWSKIRVTGY